MKELLEKYDNLVVDYNKIIVESFSAKDFMDYTEILFSAHSCAVEGNTFTVEETRDLKEKGLSLKLQNRSLLEAYEIIDHFKAYEFLFRDLQQPITEDLIIETQRILTSKTIEFTKGYKPGEYTSTQMGAGDTVFGDYKTSIARMPLLAESAQQAIEKAELHPLEISARFHQFFIYLHAFPDGNGRTGRLISNFILAKFKLPHVIVTANDKTNYIDALKQAAKHQDPSILTAFFASISIERMQSEIDQKKMLTESQAIDFNPNKKSNS